MFQKIDNSTLQRARGGDPFLEWSAFEVKDLKSRPRTSIQSSTF